jgi:hypothetical protein
MAGADDSFDATSPRVRPGDLTTPRSSPARRHDPMAALTRFVGESAVDQAARSRSRSRWQRQLAVEEATWLGLLGDLAETHAPAVVDTTIGRRLRGVIATVGSDFVTITTAAGGLVVLAAAAIASVQLAPGQPGAIGRAATANLPTLHGLLTELAADRPTLTWYLSDDASISGQLLGVGRGFVQLRIAGTPPSISYLPIGERTMIGLDG